MGGDRARCGWDGVRFEAGLTHCAACNLPEHLTSVRLIEQSLDELNEKAFDVESFEEASGVLDGQRRGRSVEKAGLHHVLCRDGMTTHES